MTQYFGNFISNLFQIYKEINPATLTGAIDVIAVQQKNGDIFCSPFHVRFGKMGVLRSREKIVDIEINGEVVDLQMKLGEAGEAYFVEEIEPGDEVPSFLATSPISKPDALMAAGLREMHSLCSANADVLSSAENPSGPCSAPLIVAAAKMPSDPYALRNGSAITVDATHYDSPLEPRGQDVPTSKAAALFTDSLKQRVAHEDASNSSCSADEGVQRPPLNLSSQSKLPACPQQKNTSALFYDSWDELEEKVRPEQPVKKKKFRHRVKKGSAAAADLESVPISSPATAAVNTTRTDVNDGMLFNRTMSWHGSVSAHLARMAGNSSQAESGFSMRSQGHVVPPTPTNTPLSKQHFLGAARSDERPALTTSVRATPFLHDDVDDAREQMENNKTSSHIGDGEVFAMDISDNDDDGISKPSIPPQSAAMETPSNCLNVLPESGPEPPLSAGAVTVTTTAATATTNSGASEALTICVDNPLCSDISSSSSPETASYSPKSDTEVDNIKRKQLLAAEVGEAEWKWGQLPEPPLSTQHQHSKDDTADVGWGISSVFPFMRKSQKNGKASDGIYLDDLIRKDNIDPNVAAMYFPKRPTGKRSSSLGGKEMLPDASVAANNAPLAELPVDAGTVASRETNVETIPSADAIAASSSSARDILTDNAALHEEETPAEAAAVASLPHSPRSADLGYLSSKPSSVCEFGEDAQRRWFAECEKLADFFSDVALSLCGGKPDCVTSEVFASKLVKYEQFCVDPSLLTHPDLIVRIQSRYYTWNVAGPMLMAMIAFQQPLSENALNQLDVVGQTASANTIPNSLCTDNNAPATVDTSSLPHVSSSSSIAQARQQHANSYFSWWRRAASVEPTSTAVSGVVVTAHGNSKPAFSLSTTHLAPITNEFEQPYSSSTPISTTAPVSISQIAPIMTSSSFNSKGARLASSNSVYDSDDENQSFQRKCKKSLRLSSEQLKQLNLKYGENEVKFSVTTKYQGTTWCSCHLYLWSYSDKIVVSDIDGTITKSDVLGHILPLIGGQWAQAGVAQLFTRIVENGYRLVYLSARAIGQKDTTKSYLKSIRQDKLCIPEGPLLLSPTSLMAALHREVIEKKPEEFKISALNDVKALFPHNPFYAGYGNRINDVYAYRAVGVPDSKIFIINPAGEVRHELTKGFQSSYTLLAADLVDFIFPPLLSSHTSEASTRMLYNEYTDDSVEAEEDFNNFAYWQNHFEVGSLDDKKFAPPRPKEKAQRQPVDLPKSQSLSSYSAATL